MNRREILQGSVAAAATAAFWPAVSRGQSVAPPRLIDVHCHIFNADDLPMVDFIEKSIIGATLRNQKIKPFVPVIDVILQDMARRLRYAARNENRYLDAIAADPSRIRAPAEIAAAEKEFLVRLLTEWKNSNVRFPAGEKLTTKIFAKYLPLLAIGFLRREMFKKQYWVPIDMNVGGVLNNADFAFTMSAVESVGAAEFDPRYMADQVYDDPQGEISYSIKWAISFARYRREMLDELHRVNDRRAALVTPALVDFNKWLDAADNVPMTAQVALMERLSREKRSDAPHMHGFVAFDPLRQAMHEKQRAPAAASPRAVVEKAVMEQGFIGVKLYPPMGFRASGNAAAGDDFPCWVRFGKGSPDYDRRCAIRTNAPGALGNEPGAILDQVMLDFFTWCAEHQVPVMAHTTNSNGAGPGYGARANPKYWTAILEKLPTLRVNFAHFGDFQEAYDDPRDDGVLNPKALDKTWEWEIGRMAAKHPEWAVFTDFSYFNEILGGDTRKRRQTLDCMRAFKTAFVDTDTRLMYGTDWSMLGREQAFAQRSTAFPTLVAAFLQELDYGAAQRDNIFFRNAVRFLGLRAEDRAGGTRGRLERLYGADAGWLGVFDAV